jgi:putative redox protein
MSYDIQTIKKELMADTAVLVDVREKDEWDDAHFAGARLIPLSDIEKNRVPDTLERDKTLYLYCRRGIRVFHAAPLLQKMGFERVIPLQESFQILANHGFEVSSGKMLHLDIQSTGDCTFEAKNSLGITSTIEGPQNLGGTFSGLRPMETVLAGLAGCSAVDIVHIMKKSRKTLLSLNVSVDGKRSEHVPGVFESIHLHFRAEGDFDKKSLERACELSVQKYCSVARMLAKTAVITHSCEKH